MTDHVAVDAHADQALTHFEFEPDVHAKVTAGGKLGKNSFDSEEGGEKRKEATAGEMPGVIASTEVGYVSSNADVFHRGNKHDVAPGFPFIKRTEANGAQSLRRPDDEGERNPESAVHNRSKGCYRNRVDASRFQGHFHEPRESIPDVAVASIPTKRKEGEVRKSIPLRTAETLVEEVLSGAPALDAREEQGVGKGSLGKGRWKEKEAARPTKLEVGCLSSRLGARNMVVSLVSLLSSAPKQTAHSRGAALMTRVNETLKVSSTTEAKAVTATV